MESRNLRHENMLQCLSLTACLILLYFLQAFEALVKEMGSAADKSPRNGTLTSQQNYRLHETVDGGSQKTKCLQC